MGNRAASASNSLRRRAKSSRNQKRSAAGIGDDLRVPDRLMGQIEYVPPDSLKGYRQNARRHSKKQIKLLGGSMRAFGFITPVIIDESGIIIAGHARVLAAKREGIEFVPVIRVTHLTQTEQRAFRLADNRLAELADWDQEILAREFEFLVDIGFELGATGFETPEIDFIIDDQLDPGDLGPADQLPEGKEDNPVVSRLGDLWWLSENSLLCGDARDPVAFSRLMGGRLAQMVFTDPPYNVEINGNVSGLGKISHEEFIMASGEMTDGEFSGFLDQAIRNVVAYSQNGSVHYIFMDWRHQHALQTVCRQHYTRLLNLCVWNKTNAGMGSLYRSQHELVLVFKNGDGPHINNVQLGKYGRNRSNVWTYAGVNTFDADRRKDLALHPTVKPVALVSDAIRDCSKRRGIILDPFSGSGTTIIAAEETGRRCCAMELDPRYIDVAIRRWQAYTGHTAILAPTGESFEVVAKMRATKQLLLPPPLKSSGGD